MLFGLRPVLKLWGHFLVSLFIYCPLLNIEVSDLAGTKQGEGLFIKTKMFACNVEYIQ